MTHEYTDEIVLINIKKLIGNKITVEDYFFSYMIYKGEKFKLARYLEAFGIDERPIIERLLGDGWLELYKADSELNLNNLQTSQELQRVIEENLQQEAVEDWFNTWYDLWPTGIKSGGYYLRTDKRGTYRKMKQFTIDYPYYNKDLIIKATKNYLMEQSILGYTHTKLSPYFINKDGMSVLAGECESIGDAPEIDLSNYAGEEI